MNESTRRRRIALVVALVVAAAAAYACKPKTESSSGAAIANDGPEIPAPSPALNDSSPVTAFIAYGDSLTFATDTPGFVDIRHVVNGATSNLRIRSELRLPNTTVGAYTRGRIIARFETMNAPSQYGAPVGNAYLWVRDTGGGNFRSVLMWHGPNPADTGRAIMGQHLHSDPRVALVRPECLDVTFGSDTTRACCLCGGGEYNCMSAYALTRPQLDDLLTRVGRARRP